MGERERFSNSRGSPKDVSSFLFHNFPSNWESIHLWKMFERFGKVADVYIPKKFLRNGRRFGFVRFFEVRDIKSMEISLNTIWIGCFKLRVYVAKPRYGIHGSPSNIYKAGHCNGGHSLVLPSVRGVGSRSYAQVVKGGGNVVNPGENLTHGLERPQIRVESIREITDYLKSCLVLSANDLLSVDDVESRCAAEGLEVVEVKYLHGLTFLIKLNNETDVEQIVNNKENSFHKLGAVVTKWASSVSLTRRRAEIEIRGIPIPAWSDAIFQKIASRWGDVLDLKNCSFSTARNLEAGLVLILTDKASKISACTQIEVEGVIFQINIEEKCSISSMSSQRIGLNSMDRFSESEGSLIDSDWLESTFQDQVDAEEEINSNDEAENSVFMVKDTVELTQVPIHISHASGGTKKDEPGIPDSVFDAREEKDASPLQVKGRTFADSKQLEVSGIQAGNGNLPFSDDGKLMKSQVQVGDDGKLLLSVSREGERCGGDEIKKDQPGVPDGEAQYPCDEISVSLNQRSNEELSVPLPADEAQMKTQVPISAAEEVIGKWVFGESSETPVVVPHATSSEGSNSNFSSNPKNQCPEPAVVVPHAPLPPLSSLKKDSLQPKSAPPHVCGPVPKATKPLSELNNFHINLSKYFEPSKHKGSYVDPVPISCSKASISTGTRSNSYRDVGRLIGFSWENDDQSQI